MIVDKAVREAVRQKYLELGEEDPKIAFNDPKNLPFIVTKTNKRRSIKKARVVVPGSSLPVGTGIKRRYVKTKENHHIEFFQHKSSGKWDFHLVTMLEAVNANNKGGRVYDKDRLGADYEFRFSLARNECLKLDLDGEETLLRIVNISGSKKSLDMEARKINDARKAILLRQKENASERIRLNLNKIKNGNPRKVMVTNLGEVRWARD